MIKRDSHQLTRPFQVLRKDVQFRNIGFFFTIDKVPYISLNKQPLLGSQYHYYIYTMPGPTRPTWLNS